MNDNIKSDFKFSLLENALGLSTYDVLIMLDAGKNQSIKVGDVYLEKPAGFYFYWLGARQYDLANMKVSETVENVWKEDVEAFLKQSKTDEIVFDNWHWSWGEDGIVAIGKNTGKSIIISKFN